MQLMQPALELIQLAQLIRTTAGAVESTLDKRVEAGSDQGLGPKAVQRGKVELGVAYQSLVRAAQALDVVRAS